MKSFWSGVFYGCVFSISFIEGFILGERGVVRWP